MASLGAPHRRGSRAFLGQNDGLRSIARCSWSCLFCHFYMGTDTDTRKSEINRQNEKTLESPVTCAFHINSIKQHFLPCLQRKAIRLPRPSLPLLSLRLNDWHSLVSSSCLVNRRDVQYPPSAKLRGGLSQCRAGSVRQGWWWVSHGCVQKHLSRQCSELNKMESMEWCIEQTQLTISN